MILVVHLPIFVDVSIVSGKQQANLLILNK